MGNEEGMWRVGVGGRAVMSMGGDGHGPRLGSDGAMDAILSGSLVG